MCKHKETSKQSCTIINVKLHFLQSVKYFIHQLPTNTCWSKEIHSSSKKTYTATFLSLPRHEDGRNMPKHAVSMNNFHFHHRAWLKHMQQNSFNLEADTPEIMMLWQLQKIVQESRNSSKKASRSVFTSTTVVPPDPMSLTPSNLQLWKLMIHSLIVLQHPWPKVKRLQKTHMGTLMPLNHIWRRYPNVIHFWLDVLPNIGVVTKNYHFFIGAIPLRYIKCSGILFHLQTQHSSVCKQNNIPLQKIISNNFKLFRYCLTNSW